MPLHNDSEYGEKGRYTHGPMAVDMVIKEDIRTYTWSSGSGYGAQQSHMYTASHMYTHLFSGHMYTFFFFFFAFGMTGKEKSI